MGGITFILAGAAILGHRNREDSVSYAISAACGALYAAIIYGLFWINVAGA